MKEQDSAWREMILSIVTDFLRGPVAIGGG